MSTAPLLQYLQTDCASKEQIFYTASINMQVVAVLLLIALLMIGSNAGEGMADYVHGVNPSILIWARERAGYSREDVAMRLKKSVDAIEAWEAGTELPTYTQLEQLAHGLYKRPIALFFFPEPPQEPEPQRSFRTLPDSEIRKLDADTRYAIRQAQAMQLSLEELSGGQPLSERMMLQDIHLNLRDDVAAAALEVRRYIDVSIQTQLAWKRMDDALVSWRDAVQSCGVFVFKRSFKQDDISGFCLLHEEFPVIFLNNSTAKTRQIFTLFHELAHLLLGTNGITKQDDRYITQLDGEDRAIEIFCNRFAGEFLVPASDFERRLDVAIEPSVLASSLAALYNVSRELILRKLLDRRMITQAYYERQVALWLADYDKQRQQANSSGGNYYATQATYLGTKYMELAFRRYYEGALTVEQLASYLNVKASSVDGIEQQMLRKAAA